MATATTTTAAAPVVTKSEIVTVIAASSSLSREAAEHAYDAVLKMISAQLSVGRDVRLSGIGSLRTSIAPSRISRNPRTGEKIEVPERRVVRFSLSKELKEAMNPTAQVAA